MAHFLHLAALTRMFLFVYPIIAPLQKIMLGMTNFSFNISCYRNDGKKRDKQIKYTVLLAAVIMQLH